MKSLVVGGAGYIGSVVTRQLLAEGHDVVVLDDCSTGHADAVPAGVELAKADITNSADVLAGELADGSRMVAENEHWVAFVPFAARWPVEAHLYPRRQVRDLTALDGVERAALAELYLEVIKRMEGIFDDTLPSITGVQQAPVHAADEDFRLHLEVFSIRRDVGKLKFLAGSESAMGAFVNDITPEVAAERLRAVDIDTERVAT